jgi:hypothetical protein
MTRVAITVAGVLWAVGAGAQGVYVGGAIGAEVVRTSSTRSGGSTYDSGSGEALAGAIRVGTAISERFGVELEFFRPGEIEAELGGPIYLAALDSPSYRSWSTSPIVGSALFPDLTVPSIIGQTTRVRASTTSALLVARQALGSRVELAYLGGIGFSRVVRETEFGFPRGVIPLLPSIRQASYSTRTTQYAAGPVAGVEVRAGMTEHAQLVAGVRIHTLGQSVVDGWMIRPTVGLGWRF